MIAGASAFVLLFVVQNVFSQQVFTPVYYQASAAVVSKLQQGDRYDDRVTRLGRRRIEGEAAFRRAVRLQIDDPKLVQEILAMLMQIFDGCLEIIHAGIFACF